MKLPKFFVNLPCQSVLLLDNAFDQVEEEKKSLITTDYIREQKQQEKHPKQQISIPIIISL